MIKRVINAILRFFELDKKETWLRLAIFGIVMGIFYIFYFKQERGVTNKLKECSFYTIMEPRRMSDINTMYFDFFYDYKMYSYSSSVGSEDLGFSYTRNSALSRKYWIQVNCDDFKVNRVLWKIPIPDTLKYIPPKGWKKIPYGLKEESVWFKRWRN